ncbi:MAG: hypothetical protein LUG51_11410 [Tannerellaceae bacterium]|nr:hypothetical protein [Tannerellaceae bacterium]
MVASDNLSDATNNKRPLIPMKTVIFICWLYVCTLPLQAQELKYFYLEEPQGRFIRFKMKDGRYPTPESEKICSGYKDADFESLKAIMKKQFLPLFENCTPEEIDILKQLRILYFFNENYKLTDFSGIILSTEYKYSFSKIEKYVYDYICLHEDMSYIDPYVTKLEEDSANIHILYFRFSWLFE